MQELQTITIKEYLTRKGIAFSESGKELITHCLFNGCDEDSRNNEAHLYFQAETGQYNCKKCGETGNIITLARHLGDDIKDVAIDSFSAHKKGAINQLKATYINPDIVAKCHKELPERIRRYLNKRGLTDDFISEFKLGYGQFYKKSWITIPITDIDGNVLFFKLRQDPDDKDNPHKLKAYPSGSKATIYGLEMLKNNEDMIMICEGEFDRLILLKNGIPAITSTAGAGTFKEGWLENLSKLEKIYICFDKDEAGEKGAEKVIKVMAGKLPEVAIYKTTLPERMNEGKDITDYFIKYNGTPDELIYKLSKQVAGKKPIDVSKFTPLKLDDIIKILGLTIKKDEENKIVTFLCELSAYTESSQFNISFNAPSSTGKSYIPTEIAQLFPEKDVKEIGYCSPTAFFHDVGAFNKEREGYEIDLSRKILIFLDQPHTMLLERLRPLLSHDKKEMHLKITDKSQKSGLRTKNVFIKGYPSVIFCSAGLKIDEQESTRFLLLSPQTDKEKIRESIIERIKKESDNSSYSQWLNSDSSRIMLKERIEAIKKEKIEHIKIKNPKIIEEKFFKGRDILKPRHQRDVGRLISLIKSIALLNLWFREREDNIIIANEEDISEAVKLWDKISESQEYNLPPYIYQLYQEVIITAWQDLNNGKNGIKIGVSRKDIMKKHFKVYGRMIQDWQLRQQIIPMLETAGLITEERDSQDKRKTLIYPTTL
ncbi:toprim domain-containing protein [Patescibacteria group bacterium]